MTPKQKMDYVIQITAALVSSTGNPSAAKSHLRNIVQLVDEVEAISNSKTGTRAIGETKKAGKPALLDRKTMKRV